YNEWRAPRPCPAPPPAAAPRGLPPPRGRPARRRPPPPPAPRPRRRARCSAAAAWRGSLTGTLLIQLRRVTGGERARGGPKVNVLDQDALLPVGQVRQTLPVRADDAR